MVRLGLLVLAAIEPKVIGTYRGSRARKTTVTCVTGLVEWANMEWVYMVLKLQNGAIFTFKKL